MSINQQQRTYKPLVVIEDYIARKLRERGPRTDSQLRYDILDIIKESALNDSPLTFTGMENALFARNLYFLDPAHLEDLLMELWDGGEIEQVNIDGDLVWRLVW